MKLTEKLIRATLDGLETMGRLPATYELHVKDLEIPKTCSFLEVNGERFVRVEDSLDLMRDEFQRIKALVARNPFGAVGVEILGLCERATTLIEQSVPVVVQRDEAVANLKHCEVDLSAARQKINSDETARKALDARLRRLVTVRKVPECISDGQICCEVVIDKYAATEMPEDELLGEVMRRAVADIHFKAKG